MRKSGKDRTEEIGERIRAKVCPKEDNHIGHMRESSKQLYWACLGLFPVWHFKAGCT